MATNTNQIHIYKYTNTQIHIYTNTQIHNGNWKTSNEVKGEKINMAIRKNLIHKYTNKKDIVIWFPPA